MKTIGLLGGMSWESTVTYYQLINREVKQRLGKLHSAKIVLYSVDFEEIEVLQHAGRWEEAGAILAKAAQTIEAAGADLLVLCTNTMHLVAPQIQIGITIPMIHIADATAAEIKAKGQKRVGLLGTEFTMSQEFYKGRLMHKHGINVLIPNEEDRAIIHSVIYEELCLGYLKPESRASFVRIANELGEKGAESVILGCTEIGLLLKQKDTPIPLLDTTTVHAHAAVTAALG